PRKPKCGICPWQEPCRARSLGIAEELPHRIPKILKPTRYGKVFWIRKKTGEILIEKRVGKGLYEGMYQLPTTEWILNATAAKKLSPPYARDIRFRPLNMTVRHGFTHFNIVLEIWGGTLKANPRGQRGIFVSIPELDVYALPSLMRKAVKSCLA
ncbi:MAG: NUDIX domain-containing protein, partial [Pseudomonadota bacterium]